MAVRLRATRPAVRPAVATGFSRFKCNASQNVGLAVARQQKTAGIIAVFKANVNICQGHKLILNSQNRLIADKK
jgi:hypothetical protein